MSATPPRCSPVAHVVLAGLPRAACCGPAPVGQGSPTTHCCSTLAQLDDRRCSHRSRRLVAAPLRQGPFALVAEARHEVPSPSRRQQEQNVAFPPFPNWVVAYSTLTSIALCTMETSRRDGSSQAYMDFHPLPLSAKNAVASYKFPHPHR